MQNKARFAAAARRIVVFTDPDTLRGGGKSSLSATRAALNRLANQGVAVVLWGNETRAELELIREDLYVKGPFVTETGGGLFVPFGYFPALLGPVHRLGGYHVFEFARPHHQVAELLHQVASKLDIEVIGFREMSVQEVADGCRLSLPQAQLAKLREYDEPFRIVDPDPAVRSRLFNALNRSGLRCFSHERYHHVTGVTDKAASVRLMTSLYRRMSHDVLTVGLVTNPAESCLLDTVDIPVVVQSASVDVSRLLRKVPTARLAGAPDPWGWTETILNLANAETTAR